MKSIFILLILLICMFPMTLSAQMFYSAPKSNVSVIVEDDSYVRILGKTNVNTFTCDYVKEIPKDTIEVSVRQTGNKLILNNASLKVKVDGFDCGNQMMNKDFRSLLKDEEHPYITITIKSLEPVNELVASNKDAGYSELGFAKVEFEIAGVKNEYKIPLNTFDQVVSQFYLGQKTLNITDFQLNPPKKFMGLVKVEEEISLDFRLNLNFVY